MDVRKGQCWRCQGSGTDITCQRCGKASYCCDDCCSQDKVRHQSMCEMWSPKCSNQYCSKGEDLKECSSCNYAYYCSTSCQRQHWKTHKFICRKRVNTIKNATKDLAYGFFDRTRIAQRPLGIPYYIGNDLAMDLLNLQGNEMLESSHTDVLNQDFSILSAGCGNIRHLIYTITSLPKEFRGKLRVTLNDIDPFMQARNLLFLFMMIHFSSKPDIACIITTIWYSLHLREDEHKLLIDSLGILCTTDHKQLMVMTRGVIDIKDGSLLLLQQVWEGWLKVDQEEKSWRKLSLSQQRDKMRSEDPDSDDGFKCYYARIQKRHRDSAILWVQHGDFLPSGKTAKNQRENPTLTGRKNRGIGRIPFGAVVKSVEEQIMEAKMQPKDIEFDFCITSDLIPFGEWDYLAMAKYSNHKSLIVMTHAFATNQLQQTISFINKQQLHINIDLGSCLEMVGEGNEKYDRIITSNIADYVGHKTLLDVMKPLLSTTNKNAVIVTHSMNWVKRFPEAYADDLMHMVDGSRQNWIESAKEDTKQDLRIRPRNWYQEYFNNSPYFINYLRADLMSSNIALDAVHSAEDKVPSFQEVKLQCSGLRMRDFRYQLNKVAPFKYRQNVRTVNMLSGTSRMLEWYISE